MAGIATEFGNPAMIDLLAPVVSEERGRKNRRTSDSDTVQPVAHNPSGESTTLRGRGRRRSTSGASSQSTDTSKARTRTMSPPMRKYQKKTLVRDPAHKKRSQSPSRSRSKESGRTPRRRRQRTTSRSRSHDVNKSARQGVESAGKRPEKELGFEPAK